MKAFRQVCAWCNSGFASLLALLGQFPECTLPPLAKQIESKEQLYSLPYTRLYQVFEIILFIALFAGIPLMVVSLLTQLAVGGINFAPKAASFKGSKINPIKGLKEYSQ